MDVAASKPSQREKARSVIRLWGLLWSVGYWVFGLLVLPFVSLMYEEIGDELPILSRVLLLVSPDTPIKRFLFAEANVVVLAVIVFASRNLPEDANSRGVFTTLFLLSTFALMVVLVIGVFLPGSHLLAYMGSQ